MLNKFIARLGIDYFIARCSNGSVVFEWKSLKTVVGIQLSLEQGKPKRSRPNPGRFCQSDFLYVVNHALPNSLLLSGVMISFIVDGKSRQSNRSCRSGMFLRTSQHSRSAQSGVRPTLMQSRYSACGTSHLAITIGYNDTWIRKRNY